MYLWKDKIRKSARLCACLIARTSRDVGAYHHMINCAFVFEYFALRALQHSYNVKGHLCLHFLTYLITFCWFVCYFCLSFAWVAALGRLRFDRLPHRSPEGGYNFITCHVRLVMVMMLLSQTNLNCLDVEWVEFQSESNPTLSHNRSTLCTSTRMFDEDLMNPPNKLW